MDRLQKMAQQMAQAQQGLKNGDGKKAADAMKQMAQQVAEMQKDMDQLKQLDAMMDQMELAKDAMVCKNCNGEGCEECQGNMFGMNMNKDDMNMNGKPGPAMGPGRGVGKRPEDRGATSTRETQVKQNSRRGAATFGGLVEGPNIKGEVAQSIKEEMAQRAAEPADPLTSDRLPHSRREQAEQYFQALRDGK